MPNCPNPGHLKNRSFYYIEYGLDLTFATITWSVCNEIYHNACRYEYITFQILSHLHKQYIFDANNKRPKGSMSVTWVQWTHQKFDFEMEQKQQHFIPHAVHLVCCWSLPVWRISLLEEGDPLDLFLPRPGSVPGRIWSKNNNTCKGPWILHPYQVSSKSIKRFWKS